MNGFDCVEIVYRRGMWGLEDTKRLLNNFSLLCSLETCQFSHNTFLYLCLLGFSENSFICTKACNQVTVR